ncbi:MAG: VWA domain-containing protein [Planctomycetales bacterium]|nr:VWA domain-containing protein [Planctomycetales bacterium]
MDADDANRSPRRDGVPPNQPRPLGGIVHVYQKYDPQKFPSPTQEAPDLVSAAFDHLLMYGSMRELTDEELARAIRLDPSQFAGLGPSLESLLAILKERRRKILERYDPIPAKREADRHWLGEATQAKPPAKLEQRYQQAVAQRQIYDLERLWYATGDERHPFARHLLRLMQRLSDVYEIDELLGKYQFTGKVPVGLTEALEIKEELERIDELIRQLEEAARTARIGVIDLEALAEFAEPGDLEALQRMQEEVERYVREQAQLQGLAHERGAFQLSPQAYRVFQGRLLERLFSQLESSRTGRHQGPIEGAGDVELSATRPYEFGDSPAQMDLTQSLTNAMLRSSRRGGKLRLEAEDIEVHRTRNSPKCATVVIMDMSGSMRYDGQYINVKRMALALDGLVRREYPGDFVAFIEMASFAHVRTASEIVELMPKPVTIHDPFVQLAYDMSRPEMSESLVHPHFTNIQHALLLARRLLSAQDTPNRQIVLITDGLPTAHFEDQHLLLLYPPHQRTEEITMREGHACAREGITLNMFLVPSWSQSEEDIRFAHRLAETTAGRVFFTAGKDLDRFVVWDYLNHRREIIS